MPGFSIVLGTTCLLIIPFVELYTRGVVDINYINKPMALMILLTVLFETIHIPSGQIIQMSGEFDAYKRMQSISCIFLVVLMMIGRFTLGIYGIIGSVLGTAILIAIMEIYYTGKRIFNRKMRGFVVNTIPCFVVCGLMTILGYSGIIKCPTYYMFLFEGIVGFIVSIVLSTILYFIVDSNGMKALIKRVISSIRARTK